MARSNPEHLARARERLDALHEQIDELENEAVNAQLRRERAIEHLQEIEDGLAELESIGPGNGEA